MATYSKVNETTLKISTVVEQEITLEQLTQEQIRLSQDLGSLEEQYTQQKENIMARLKMVNEAVKEAGKLEVKNADIPADK